ncbi:MAG: transglycosylase SLT domain-containing protein [Candidatus Woesearchaeota archaeon]
MGSLKDLTLNNIKEYVTTMNRKLLLTGGFLATLGAGAFIGHVTSDIYSPSKVELKRDHAQQISQLEQKIEDQQKEHTQEIAELSAVNAGAQSWYFELEDEVQMLDEKVTDQKFLLAHAVLQIIKAKGEQPEYDWDRFLRRQPEARKYFPYLIDAVKKYKDIWPVDPMFALAILKQESRFGTRIVSDAGALGDAQFIESTWNDVSRVRASEPYTWKAGRRQYAIAKSLRDDAKEVRDVFIGRMVRGLDLTLPSSKVKEQLATNFNSNSWRLESYYHMLDDAEKRKAEGDEAFKIYSDEITLALSQVPKVEKEVRARQKIEAETIYITEVRPQKTDEEKRLEVDLAVNHYLMQIDPRLSPMLFTDALVKHLAELFFKFNGDERFVASRYNASMEALRRSVRSVGGIGIPLIDQTQDYVNMVYVYRAMLAYDAGITDKTFQITCCSNYAER